jgi:ABC-type sugar transport system ATPase subunit
VKLELEAVRKSFGGVEVLHGVSLTGEGGQVVAVVGANGAGKSTLIKVLAGAHNFDSGQLLIDGEELGLRSPRDAILRGIRTVYQELSLVPELTVTENMLMGDLPRTGGLIDWTAAHRRAGEILQEIGFTGIDPHTRIRRLSVAKQQMVEIAKSLVTEPRVLILDEPSAVLAGSDLDALFTLVRKLTARGTLVIYISHRLVEVLELADKIVMMKDGTSIAELDPAKTSEDEMIHLMAGRAVGQIYPDRRSEFGEPALELKDLAREGEFKGVSLTIRSGEVVGLFGLVGSGRSELAEAVFGARQATGGTMAVRGRILRARNPKTAMRLGMALVTEDRGRTGLVLGLPVRDNVILATMKGPLMRMRPASVRASRRIKELDIRPAGCATQPAWQLSGGNQQKTVLAKWLETEPSILLLDEPTRGVDMATRIDIYRMVDSLARAGLAILLISSDLTEAIGASDRLLVMREGQMVGELDPASVTEEEVLAYSIGTQP